MMSLHPSANYISHPYGIIGGLDTPKSHLTQQEQRSKMHLWPSMRLRDSFKNAYLKKLELNLHLMKLDKKKRQQDSQASTSDGNNENDNQEKLLSGNIEDPSKGGGKFVAVCRELLLIISFCYCCFGCGACVDEEGS